MPGSIETDTANVDELNRDISEAKKTSISDGQAPLSEDVQTIYKTSPSPQNRRSEAKLQIKALKLLARRCQKNFRYLNEAANYAFEHGYIEESEYQDYKEISMSANGAKQRLFWNGKPSLGELISVWWQGEWNRAVVF